MRAYQIAFTTSFLWMVSPISWGQTTDLQNNLERANQKNICQNFSVDKVLIESQKDAPPPVRTLENINPEPENISVSEEILYQQLGLIPSKDGSYVCLVTDPNNERRKFTLFKVKKIDKILVASTFLDRGDFLAKQERATTDLFLEMIRFYTNLPEQYYEGLDNYFQEFYSRIANGRLKPSSDRVYAVDEPSTTVIMFHPLQGDMKGTAISLNINLL